MQKKIEATATVPPDGLVFKEFVDRHTVVLSINDDGFGEWCLPVWAGTRQSQNKNMPFPRLPIRLKLEDGTVLQAYITSVSDPDDPDSERNEWVIRFATSRAVKRAS